MSNDINNIKTSLDKVLNNESDLKKFSILFSKIGFFILFSSPFINGVMIPHINLFRYASFACFMSAFICSISLFLHVYGYGIDKIDKKRCRQFIYGIGCFNLIGFLFFFYS